ncbi:MAG: erythromycin esterase family protein [Bacteroidetes bacterium]|nr:erythromycin esterase family protein [Bacteroidota bacterium]
MKHQLTGIGLDFPFLLILCFITLQSHPQTQVIIGKSYETIYPLTPNQTDDQDELLPLASLLKDRKVVGMGEATHGTKEFFNMKAKMFKFLATHCGYRVFTIEATYGGTLKVNDYVLYGKGDVLSAMKGMEFWTWDTEEVKDLIEWMKSYNETRPDKEKLKFYGFDCQSYKGPANALIEYVKEFDKPNLDKFVKGLSVLNDSSYNYFYTLKPGKASVKGISQIHAIISFIREWFRDNENLYAPLSGRLKFELANHNVESLEQVILLSSSQRKIAYTRRDSCMAQNIKWISELEQAKVFAWAHNSHICKNAKYYFNRYKTMGCYLNEIFGDAYYNTGFVFNQGSFQAIPKAAAKLQEFTITVNRKNTLTNELALVGIDSFFIDLDSSENALFKVSKQTYNIGALYNPEHAYAFTEAIIAKQLYDGLIFINNTASAVPVKRDSVK